MSEYTEMLGWYILSIIGIAIFVLSVWIPSLGLEWYYLAAILAFMWVTQGFLVWFLRRYFNLKGANPFQSAIPSTDGAPIIPVPVPPTIEPPAENPTPG